MKKTILITLVLVQTNIVLIAQSSYGKYFDDCNVGGSVTIYDYKNEKWIFTDSIDAHTSSLPASTFKIINSLIALETKVVENENQLMNWDGSEKRFFGQMIPEWNRDADLKHAFRNSTIWFYEELAKKIGRKRYAKYLKKTQYGNLNLTEKGVDFWNYGDFGITPKNQIEFLIKLYENRLPFSTENMNTVKQMMISVQTDSITYSDKTGWTKKAGEDIGWYIGYAEKDGNVYFFATRLTNSDPENPDFAKCRKTITEKMLDEIINQVD